LKLTIELVPSTCWFSNVRDHVDKSTWDKLRKNSYKDANYKCQICEGKGEKWPVECHEIWNYDDVNHIQTLKGLISLCPLCHQVKHIGYTSTRGKDILDLAINHFQKVNNLTRTESLDYIYNAFEIFKERSNFQWTLNLEFLRNMGISIKEKR
jgi:5-methylcytosine-specific restriction endonuclease McrA